MTSQRNKIVLLGAIAAGAALLVGGAWALHVGPFGAAGRGSVLATVDGEREIYVCKDCGKEGLLLLFSTEEERRRFEAECRKGTS